MDKRKAQYIMEGKYKGKMLAAALILTLALFGCKKISKLEQAPEKPEKEAEPILRDADIILEGMQDNSGIFDSKIFDTEKETIPKNNNLNKDSLNDAAADAALAHKTNHENDAANDTELEASDTGRQKPEQTDEIPQKEMLTVEFTTYYGSSNQSRCSNIEHAADLLNGTVIGPGEIFSCSGTIGPVTEENGYKPAGTYVGGKVQEGIGGGVCQVSSTLYNAALLAGLTVVERSPHSMIVSYVEPGRDAAIAGDYKDLKLRNDFQHPVVIEASAKDGTICMTIHTAQEDTGAVVSLVSVIVSETEPGEPVITVDESKPEDYYKVTQKAHTGYVAELYRVISRNGVEILKEKVNTSTYEAVPEYVTVGSEEE